MFRLTSRYVKRSRELGLLGTMRRIWMRSTSKVAVWGQSLWWGRMAREEMSDATLLARTNSEWKSLDALLDHLANRPASSFLLPHESPQESAQLLHRHYPEYVRALLTAADAICQNELSLLGHVFHYSDGIDWQTEPMTGWRWPLWHRSRIGEYLYSPMRPVDLILFWEMNRHQFFITLGIAYWLTGDQKYVEAFSFNLQRWIKTNPLQHGLNWFYPLEVSIRLLAWTAAFQFFRTSPQFRQKTGKAFLKSLWQQADFLNSHLQITRSRNDVPNNHMMAELTGLLLVGIAFPEFRAAAAWRETGLRLLNQQATAQTHSDGVNKEQAIGYHRFVAELLLLVVARSHRGALPHAPILEQTLERMLDYMLFSLTPVGTAPMWGDSDYGRALGLGQNKDFWDFRPILSAGAALFGRSEWKFAARRFDEEAFWLLGRAGLARWEQLEVHAPEQTAQAFPQAGLYVMRDGWTADTDVAFFRGGPFGLGGEGHCAHAHCDLLSIVLWVSGQPLLVDSGTYTYHGPWRDPFRLTGAHNTVMVDRREQAKPMPYFNWKQIPKARCINWNKERLAAAMICSNRVEFTRELTHTQPGIWELADRFTGNAEHQLEWFFHFAPGLELQMCEGEHTLTVLKQHLPFLVMHLPGNGIRFQVRDSWYSYQYGVKQSNLELYGQWQGQLDGKGVWFHWQFQHANERLLSKEGIRVNAR